MGNRIDKIRAFFGRVKHLRAMRRALKHGKSRYVNPVRLIWVDEIKIRDFKEELTDKFFGDVPEGFKAMAGKPVFIARAKDGSFLIWPDTYPDGFDLWCE